VHEDPSPACYAPRAVFRADKVPGQSIPPAKIADLGGKAIMGDFHPSAHDPAQRIAGRSEADLRQETLRAQL